MSIRESSEQAAPFNSRAQATVAFQFRVGAGGLTKRGEK